MRNILILTMSSAVLCTVNIFAADEIGATSTRAQIKPLAPQSAQVLGGGVSISKSGRNAGGKSASEWYIESINKVVPLTPDQQNTMMKIIEARDKATQEFNAKNADKLKAANQAMMDAYKSQDQAAIAKAHKENQETFAGSSAIYSKAQKELDAVLTPEQNAKRKDAQVAQMIKSLTGGVTLTPEQETKMKAVIAEGGGRESEAREHATYKAVQDLLTPEQKETIAKSQAQQVAGFKPGRPGFGLAPGAAPAPGAPQLKPRNPAPRP